MDDMMALSRMERREFLWGAPAAFGLALSAPTSAAPAPLRRGAYQVTLTSVRPLRFSVVADLPIAGDRLGMSDTYPAELPDMAGKGWPALVRDLAASDGAGRSIPLSPDGSAGWKLARPASGRVRLRYAIDFAIFEQAGWSSPLESAVTDAEHAVSCCRAFFITTPIMAGADVRFRTPPGWRAVPPWPAVNPVHQSFRAASTADLTENMAVFTSRPGSPVSAAGFTMAVTAMGHWAPLLPVVRETLRTIVGLEVGMMEDRRREAYNVILVPTIDTGGEAYRQSFAYAFANPTVENRAAWANTLAHELFHFWNASRLQGRDYAASQWFQEGFTEYVANLTLLVGKIVRPEDFLAKLASHVANSRRLTTTLENIGTHKGPPLYSAGALVAFSFDAIIRNATQGRRSIGTFFRNLWRQTGEGARKYAWPDIEAALRATAPGNWAGFYARHIRGPEKLPLEQTLGLAGLRLQGSSVTTDLAAASTARLVWESLKLRL